MLAHLLALLLHFVLYSKTHFQLVTTTQCRCKVCKQDTVLTLRTCTTATHPTLFIMQHQHLQPFITATTAAAAAKQSWCCTAAHPALLVMQQQHLQPLAAVSSSSSSNAVLFSTIGLVAVVPLRCRGPSSLHDAVAAPAAVSSSSSSNAVLFSTIGLVAVVPLRCQGPSSLHNAVAAPAAVSSSSSSNAV
jgi:hypothetical protein